MRGKKAKQLRHVVSTDPRLVRDVVYEQGRAGRLLRNPFYVEGFLAPRFYTNPHQVKLSPTCFRGAYQQFKRVVKCVR